MDLTLTPQQRAFRDEIRGWLTDNVPAERFAPTWSAEGFEQHREWERTLYRAGLAAVHWPAEFGGRGMDPLSTLLFYEEYVRTGAPERLDRLALGLAGPTIIEWGTPTQRSAYLPRMLASDHIWCQGFSEPGAGSDLAALRTRGDVGADSIVVNGQKVWTSQSRFATHIFALIRTDGSLGRHRGMTFLLIDRDTPGIEIRPIHQMNRISAFAEVFFTDVEVPLENVLGEVHQGWRVAMSTLMHERSANLNTADHFQLVLNQVLAMLPESLRDDRLTQVRIGQFSEEIEAYRYMTLRTSSSLSAGVAPGLQSMMGKLWWSEMQTRIYEFGLSLLGAEAEVYGDESSPQAAFLRRYWHSRASHIYAGSSEIQRNIIAERGLGLPKGA